MMIDDNHATVSTTTSVSDLLSTGPKTNQEKFRSSDRSLRIRELVTVYCSSVLLYCT